MSHKAFIYFRQYADDALFNRICECLNHYKSVQKRLNRLKPTVCLDNSEEDGFDDSDSSRSSSSSFGRSKMHRSESPQSPLSETRSSATLSDDESARQNYCPEEGWKEKFFDKKTGIFVAEYHRRFYRVRPVKFTLRDKV